ncbi:MAG: class I SAM-dependent methyltransferase, partial [Burkholderiales bacterium]|nr:class I SAM-dependent methyltransferase [Burkholderiales bacterium]
SLAGALASRLFKDYFEYPWDWFRMAHVGTASRILDVGCGSGHLLHALHWQGFRHVTGIDAFLGEESQLPGLQIMRREIAQMDGTFDLIMFHHSLEHMPDPISALRHAARLCSPTGAVLVRLPITGTFAWREYQDLWVQLDAPRHLFIPTQHAVEVAGKAADLRLDAVEYDSGPLQFFGSELYRKDLPLFQPDGTKTGDKLKLFPREVMDDYRARAAALNAKADGDQACFYFRKAA